MFENMRDKTDKVSARLFSDMDSIIKEKRDEEKKRTQTPFKEDVPPQSRNTQRFIKLKEDHEVVQ